MGLARRFAGKLLLASAACIAGAPAALAQDHAGIVTSLEGVAMVSRIALPEARPLQFKDDVYVRDRITTGDRSLVRVLLGGKATVTARERSVLTITDAPGISTIHLDDGRISVAVAKGLMKRGEVIEIKTPNAVAAIRGTVVVAEVVPGTSIESTISVLRGLVEVTRLDIGRPAGNSVNVGAFQAVKVAGSKPLPQPSAMSANDVNRLTAEFRIVPSGLAPGASAAALDIAKQNAIDDVASTVAVQKGQGKTAGGAAETKKHEGGEAGSAGSDERGKNAASGKGKHKGHPNDNSSAGGSSAQSDTTIGNSASTGLAAPAGNSNQAGTVATPSTIAGISDSPVSSVGTTQTSPPPPPGGKVPPPPPPPKLPPPPPPPKK